jgi:hypothetical protein
MFKSLPVLHSLRLGCGVTAYSYDDALRILQRVVLAGVEMPEIEKVEKDFDISILDQTHVVPNMEPMVWRGVWFPKGYVLSREDYFVVPSPSTS